MNELGPLLLVLAAQITLPILAGLLLSRRRNPATACGPLVLATVAVLVLTPLAFVPKPEWKSKLMVQPEAIESTSLEAKSDAVTSTAPGIDLIQLMKLAKPVPKAAPVETFNVWRIVALAAISFAAFGLLRFLLALGSTVRVVRRSRPLEDSALAATVGEVSERFGCRRVIHIRESERVGSAATVGFWRPIVLLSPTWRLWSSDERRAVLAHEIAHIARGDFVSRLLTRFALALHGYHPLLRWLAARLELRQEMAADALAAQSCGGNEAYVKSLAALALQADARPIGFVPTFLSRPRTLFRRIAMLRVKDDHATRTRRWPTLVAIALVSAAALGLRGTTPESLAGPVVQARFVADKERSPLDASFILPSKNADDVGIFAVRVGELCRTPGMEKQAEMYSTVLMSAFGDGKKTHFKLTDIEQIAGRVSLTHQPEKPKPNSSLSMSLTSARMAKDFDWVKQLKDWGTDWKEHTYAETKYFSGKMSIPALGFTDTTVWFYLPDSRTVVLESEENIKLLIDAKKKPRQVDWAADWAVLEGGMFAMVLPDVKNKLPKKLAVAKDENAELFKAIAGICSKANRAAIGVDIGEGCSFKLRFACANADDAITVDEGCQALAKMAKTIFDESFKDEPKDPAEKASRDLYSMLVRGIEFGKTVDHVVEVRITAKTGMKQVLEAFGQEQAKPMKK